jgi:hypothetical protein
MILIQKMRSTHALKKLFEEKVEPNNRIAWLNLLVRSWIRGPSSGTGPRASHRTSEARRNPLVQPRNRWRFRHDRFPRHDCLSVRRRQP